MIYDTLGPDADFTRGIPCDITLALIKYGNYYPDSETRVRHFTVTVN